MSVSKRLSRAAFIRMASVLILVLAVVMPFLLATPVLAQSVTISNTSASPGSNVTVSGSGFTSGNTYSITFAPGTIYETLLTPNTVISGTTFSDVVTIPQAPWGQYTIRVTTSSPAQTFNISFRVISEIGLSSSLGYVGDTLYVTGYGFVASRTVNIYFNAANIISSTTDFYGVLASVNFQVPAIKGGSYGLYATDGIATTKTVTFVVRPHLVTSDIQGAPGDEVTLDGTGFDDNSRILIYWDNEQLATSAINSNSVGSFTGTIIIPPDTRGSHTIRARDSLLGTDSVSFFINPEIAISPGSSSPGQNISVAGSGFRASATVTLSYDSTTLSTQPVSISTDSNGTFTATFTVPSILEGNYVIRASDGLYSATANLMVASKIELFPPYGHIGTEVVVNGNGFTPRGRVMLSYDNQVLVTVTADDNGAFSVSFNVPVSAAGPHTVTARDQTTPGIVAAAPFMMESTPPPVPTLLTPAYGSMTSVQPAFSWTPVTDPSGVSYDLQISTNSSFSILVIFKQGLQQSLYQVGQSEALDMVKKSSSYYWRVRAVDGAGNASDWTSPGSFYTEDSTPPPAPTLLSPENGSRQGGRVSFKWTSVSDPSGVTYTLQVAQDSIFTHIVVYKQGLTTTDYQLTDTEALSASAGNPPSPYYWRVAAVDGAQNQSDWSNASTFYVGGLLQGWLLYTVMGIFGLLLIAIGVLIGMWIRPAPKIP